MSLAGPRRKANVVASARSVQVDSFTMLFGTQITNYVQPFDEGFDLRSRYLEQVRLHPCRLADAKETEPESISTVLIYDIPAFAKRCQMVVHGAFRNTDRIGNFGHTGLIRLL
nr:hypothetical protein [Halorubrum sp. SD626R]